MASDDFVDEIKKFLKDYEISVNYLAVRAGISHPGLASIVSGKHEARAETIEKIRTAMKVIAEPISEFGIWLKLNRENGGISVTQLAEKAGISAPAIYNIESGKTQNPSAKTQKILSEALDIATPIGVAVTATPAIPVVQDEEYISDLEEFDPYSKQSYPELPGVYIFYDVSDRPIYVGQSSNIKIRIIEHEQKFWFKKPLVETAAFVTIRNEKLRKRIEKVFIKFLKSNAVINKGHVDRGD